MGTTPKQTESTAPEAKDQVAAAEKTPNAGTPAAEQGTNEENQPSEDPGKTALPEDSSSDENQPSDEDDDQEGAAPEAADDPDDDTVDEDPDDPKKLAAALRRVRSEAKNLRTRAKAAERVAAQYEAAAEAGLALTWATRLQGDTPEQIKADAVTLVKAVGTAAPSLRALPDDGIDRSGSQGPAEENDLGAIGSRMYSN